MANFWKATFFFFHCLSSSSLNFESNDEVGEGLGVRWQRQGPHQDDTFNLVFLLGHATVLPCPGLVASGAMEIPGLWRQHPTCPPSSHGHLLMVLLSLSFMFRWRLHFMISIQPTVLPPGFLCAFQPHSLPLLCFLILSTCHGWISVCPLKRHQGWALRGKCF